VNIKLIVKDLSQEIKGFLLVLAVLLLLPDVQDDDHNSNDEKTNHTRDHNQSQGACGIDEKL
jgi:hypothetical protein